MLHLIAWFRHQRPASAPRSRLDASEPFLVSEADVGAIASTNGQSPGTRRPVTLVPMESPEHEEVAVREYVARAFELLDDLGAITHVEKVASEPVRGQTYDVWDVHTRDDGRWWVVTCPMNYYTQEDFKSVDVVLSFHIGVTTRAMAHWEPNARPQEVERLTETWRRWQQAADELDTAKEVEDYQAVGMRLRETLVSFVGELASDELVPAGEPAPKRADVTAWCGLIAGAIAAGDRRKHLRSYLKTVAVEVWQYVNWVTHARNATLVDAGLGVEMVEHMLSMFGTALLRAELGEPAKCPACGSHRLGTDQRRSYLEQGFYVVLCQACAWREERPFEVHGDDLAEEPPPPPEGDCTPSTDIKTMMRLDDLHRRRP